MTQVPCHFCDRPVYIEMEGAWQLVTGWVPTRKQGGANKVKLAERHGKWAHTVCVDLEARGLTNQGSLGV